MGRIVHSQLALTRTSLAIPTSRQGDDMLSDQYIYTSGQVMEALVEGTDDFEMALDIGTAIAQLPENERMVLVLYVSGLTVTEAMKEAGVSDNPTRYLEKVQKHLLSIMNGEETEECTTE